MAMDERAIKYLDNSKQFNVAAFVTVLFAIFLSAQSQAKAKPQNIDAKGKEGAKQSSKQKSTKKFALKTPLKTPLKKTLGTSAKAKAEAVVAKSAPNKTNKAKLVTKTQPAAKTKFMVSKNAVGKATDMKAESPTTVKAESPTTVKAESPTTVKAESPTTVKAESPTTVKAESPTQDLFKAFASNQQNQMMAQNSKPTRRAARDTESKSKKMPSLLPTSSNDSQRAASMLEADSGVHGDDGYTRTQIVDAPVRKPAAVAVPKTPERVAITFEHEAK